MSMLRNALIYLYTERDRVKEFMITNDRNVIITVVMVIVMAIFEYILVKIQYFNFHYNY